MANYYVTTTGAGTKSGADWANAFDWAAFETHSASASIGDIYWLAGGTYTLSSAYDNTLNDISLVGVASGTTNEPPAISDHATGTGRPLIDCGANSFAVDNDWVIKNLRFTSSNATFTVDTERKDVFINCLIENTNASCTQSMYMASGNMFDCELIGGGDRILLIGSLYPCAVINCYLHGSATVGLVLSTEVTTVMGNIISGPATGIDLGGKAAHDVCNNTIYNCSSIGIDVTTSKNNTILNNTISNCGIGISGAAAYLQALVDYNNYYNNTTDVSNVTKGPNALAVDPGFTDAANGDFSLSSSSGLIDTGFGMRLGVS